MRTLCAAILVALSLTSTVTSADADAPTTLIIRNLGTSSTRIQIALGPTLPCDSSDNRMIYDGVLPAGTTRTLPLEQAYIACARHTSAGSTIDWQPSIWLRGGLRCRGLRGGTCTRDPSVPMVFDIAL